MDLEEKFNDLEDRLMHRKLENTARWDKITSEIKRLQKLLLEAAYRNEDALVIEDGLTIAWSIEEERIMCFHNGIMRRLMEQPIMVRERVYDSWGRVLDFFGEKS